MTGFHPIAPPPLPPHRCNTQNDRLYRAWHHLKDDKSIPVSPLWVNDFRAFNAWAHANGYNERLGRIYFRRTDPRKGWTPENTSILTGMRCSRYLTANGERKALIEWARQCGVSKQLMAYRIRKYGIDRAVALSAPEKGATGKHKTKHTPARRREHDRRRKASPENLQGHRDGLHQRRQGHPADE